MNRFRKSLGDLTELKNSIKEIGLIHPIVYNSEGELICGERRKKACEELGITPVYRIIDFKDNKQAEIDENVCRKDFTPSEIYEIGKWYNETLSKQFSNHYDLVGVNDADKKQPRDIVANVTGTSIKTLSKINKIFNSDNENIKKDVDSGELSINEAYKKLTVHVGNNSGDFEWYTPDYIIEAARAAMGTIDLDPASCETANEIIKATKFYSNKDDGLQQLWYGNVWLNPPYARSVIDNFSDKIIQELPNINQACVIVNNATETTWLQQLMNVCNAICFIKGRVKFYNMDENRIGAPLQGQVVLYFGNKTNNFLKEFNQYGICMTTATEVKYQI